MLGDNLDKEVELESVLKQCIVLFFYFGLFCFSLKVEGRFKGGNSNNDSKEGH